MVEPHGLNIDFDINIEWAKQNLKNTVIQGGLDPKILLLSEQEIIKNAKNILMHLRITLCLT